jgi:phage head maturation protease
MRLELKAGKLTHKSERAARRIKRLLRPILRDMGAIALKTARDYYEEEKPDKSEWPSMPGDLEKARKKKADDLTDKIMRNLREEFDRIPDEVRSSLMDAATQGVLQMKPRISDPGMIADANEAARLWAEDRAAELVGMRWVEGELVPNPNAEWAITDTTREQINRVITRAFEDVTHFEDIIEDLGDLEGFGEYRAEMVARTEVSRAQLQGNLSIWNATGMIKTYDWLISANENVCEDCQAIYDGDSEWGEGPFKFGKGPLPIEDTHPNCDCGIVSNEFELPAELAAALQSHLTKSTNMEAVTMPNEQDKKSAAAQEHFFLTLPITKFDEEQRIVEGIATAEVLDSQGDVVDYEHACKAFESWEGNIREQHDKTKAVGRAVSYTPNDEQKAIGLSVRISKGAQDTWEKVKDGTLKYFSVGCPFGSYERKPEVVKVGDQEKQANRLYINSLSEVSLVDQGACPVAKIGLWKTEDGASDVVEHDDASAEKLTEGAGNYADPGWQEDKKKRYPLDTEEHVRAAASYFGRPRNRKKYSADQQKKIDGKIQAAKKKFKIGEFAEKADAAQMDLCKYDNGQYSMLSWVPMNDYNPQFQETQPVLYYVPRTFGKIWEDTEDADIFPVMGMVFGKAIANILASQLSGDQQRALIQQSFDELIEELEDEFMEASEQVSELAEAQDEEKFTRTQLAKAGARNNKSDLAVIQSMHDNAVKLGAKCAEKDEGEKTIGSILEKANKLALVVGGLENRIKALDISKLAEGDAAKLADAIAPLLAEKSQAALKELESKAANKEDVTKLQAQTTQQGDDLAKANEALAGVTKRLEVVEKQPAVGALPIARPALGMATVEGSGGGDLGKLNDEIALLTKLQADSGDPLVREALGKELFLKKMKAGPAVPATTAP